MVTDHAATLDPTDVDVGEAIRRARIKLHGSRPRWSFYGSDPVLPIGQLARRLGLSRTTVSNIEAGKRSLAVVELGRFARALETTAVKLLESAQKIAAEREAMAAAIASPPADLPPGRAVCSKCRRIVATRQNGRELRAHKTLGGADCPSRRPL